MRVFLIAMTCLMFVSIQQAEASALSGPSCFVKAEIVDAGSEKRTLDSGKSYESFYIDSKIIEIDRKTESCPVAKDQIYRIIDNHPGTFKIGDTIRAGIEYASTMGSSGVVSFLHWLPVTYEDGSFIFYKTNVKIDHLQSGDKALPVQVR